MNKVSCLPNYITNHKQQLERVPTPRNRGGCNKGNRTIAYNPPPGEIEATVPELKMQPLWVQRVPEAARPATSRTRAVATELQLHHRGAMKATRRPQGDRQLAPIGAEVSHVYTLTPPCEAAFEVCVEPLASTLNGGIANGNADDAYTV